MNILTVTAVTVISAMMVLFIKKYSPEQAMAATVAAGCIIVFMLLSYASDAITSVRNMLDSVSYNGSIFNTVLKALGISMITKFAVDVCNDFGQTSLASKAEFAGKLMLLYIALPTVGYILESVTELIK